MKPIVWSFGGGTQTAAIWALIEKGVLPIPDLTVIADTGLETTETWEYLDHEIRPRMSRMGMEIHIAPHSLATVDLYSKKGDLLIPAYTKVGKLPTFCSNEWKTRVVRRYIRSLGIAECKMWLGMSTDEIERIKPADVQWITHEWPLCMGYGVQMNRADCLQCVRNHGMSDPPKSCCVICPHRRDKQWRRQKELYPQDHQRAVEIDKIVRANDKQGGVWLHESRKPLDEIDFSTESQQETLFGCDSGFCWT